MRRHLYVDRPPPPLPMPISFHHSPFKQLQTTSHPPFPNTRSSSHVTRVSDHRVLSKLRINIKGYLEDGTHQLSKILRAGAEGNKYQKTQKGYRGYHHDEKGSKSLKMEMEKRRSSTPNPCSHTTVGGRRGNRNNRSAMSKQLGFSPAITPETQQAGT